MDADALLNEALLLPDDVRARIAGQLIESLDAEAPDPSAQQAWATEIKRRLSEFDSGEVAPVSRADFTKRLRAAARGEDA